MLNKQKVVSKSPVKKKLPSKGKGNWCAPRKVKSTTDIVKLDDLLTTDEEPRKKYVKKARKKGKVMRRIDILAQPKSIKYPPGHKPNSTNVSKSAPRYKIAAVSPTKASHFNSPRKIWKPNKLKMPKNDQQSFIIKSKAGNVTPIVLPKKMGLRLFSIVSKRLKELSDSKSV